ncbi:MAG TPA: hypothetical protein V6D17_12885, partial [Candidatus Obscuribacterales bacterium]
FIDDLQEAWEILDDEAVVFEQHEIDEILSGPFFAGAKPDVSTDCDNILPATVAGRSVLHVGTDESFLCFETERRGAKSVGYLTSQEDSFYRALALKILLRSRVDLFNGELETLTDQRFDYIFFASDKTATTDLSKAANFCRAPEFRPFPAHES